MTVQNPIPNPGPRGSERYLRRRFVEDRLIEGLNTKQIHREALEKFGQVALSTIRADCNKISRRWLAEDRTRSSHRRLRILNRMEATSRKLRELGEHKAAADVDFKMGRLLGMGVAALKVDTLNIDRSRKTVVALGVESYQRAALDPEARAAALVLLRALQANGGALPEPADATEAPGPSHEAGRVVDVEPEPVDGEGP